MLIDELFHEIDRWIEAGMPARSASSWQPAALDGRGEPHSSGARPRSGLSRRAHGPFSLPAPAPIRSRACLAR